MKREYRSAAHFVVREHRNAAIRPECAVLWMYRLKGTRLNANN